MSLYAIGDLHLHFQSELKAPGQLRDPIWRNHENVFRQHCERMIKSTDTLVLVGDHSWGKNLAACEKDLDYICSLPGRKILLRGNHDMFWDAKKTETLNRQFAGKLFFLQNNYAAYQDYALVGTKGFTFEGPFYVRGGKIVDWDREAEQHAEQLIVREAERLTASFEAAIAERYGVEQVIYAHCHGKHRFHDSLEGRHHGIMYHLVSGDFLQCIPMCVL